MYRITYTYDNPHGAGPFKGKATVGDKYSKGDTYYGPFGAATIVSCRIIKG